MSSDTWPTDRDEDLPYRVLSPFRFRLWKMKRRYEIATKGIRWRLKLRIEGWCAKWLT